jgi:hypothetical protein
MFAVIKTFVTDISTSTGRNDFIFDIWLLHGDLYHVSPFQDWGDTVQFTMQKPYIKCKIISSSRS